MMTANSEHDTMAHADTASKDLFAYNELDDGMRGYDAAFALFSLLKLDDAFATQVSWEQLLSVSPDAIHRAKNNLEVPLKSSYSETPLFRQVVPQKGRYITSEDRVWGFDAAIRCLQAVAKAAGFTSASLLL